MTRAARLARALIVGIVATAGCAAPCVGIFVDSGVWPVGARSIAGALESAGVRTRLLDGSQLRRNELSHLDAVVLPGGWAPHQWAAAGDAGLAALERYVQEGGRCLAACAGAYLVSSVVRYEGATYRYPLALFDGVAEGPVPGLAPYPQCGPVALTPTEQGQRRGLGRITGKTFYFSGGPSFRYGTNVAVLARYDDGSAAVIARPYGHGEVVLTGVHFERSAPAAGGDDAPPPKECAAILTALLGLDR